jgi:lycopene beta-cyclase
MKSIALIGLGGAGLTFLHQFLQSPLRNWEVTVIDPNPDSAFTKTWCFWGNRDELTSVSHDMLWSTLSVKHGEDNLERPMRHLTYRCVQGSSYHKQVWDQINAHPNVTFLNDQAGDVTYESDQGKVHIQTKKSGMLTADYCFTSASQGRADNWQPRFFQQFAGGWVRFNKPVFNTDDIKLMDFDVPQHNGSVHFAYTLPRNSSEALIEITAFTPELYDAAHFETMFRKYLDQTGQSSSATYEITATEDGVIPMDTRPYVRQVHRNTFTLGTVSGMVKPSTGYAFYKMHQQALFYIRQLESGKPLRALPDASSRFRFYDDLLLDILKNDPHSTIAVFHKLFKDVPVDTVLEFLRENTSITSEVMIFMRLPKTPFLKALWRYVFKS